MADERRSDDTTPKKDAEQQKKGTGIQAATDKRDESIVMRDEGGAVEFKTPGRGSRKSDAHDLPLTGDPLLPGSRKTTITVHEGVVKVKVDGAGKEQEGSGGFDAMDYSDLMVLTTTIRQAAGTR